MIMKMMTTIIMIMIIVMVIITITVAIIMVMFIMNQRWQKNRQEIIFIFR